MKRPPKQHRENPLSGVPVYCAWRMSVEEIGTAHSQQAEGKSGFVLALKNTTVTWDDRQAFRTFGLRIVEEVPGNYRHAKMAAIRGYLRSRLG